MLAPSNRTLAVLSSGCPDLPLLAPAGRLACPPYVQPGPLSAKLLPALLCLLCANPLLSSSVLPPPCFPPSKAMFKSVSASLLLPRHMSPALASRPPPLRRKHPQPTQRLPTAPSSAPSERAKQAPLLAFFTLPSPLPPARSTPIHRPHLPLLFPSFLPLLSPSPSLSATALHVFTTDGLQTRKIECRQCQRTQLEIAEGRQMPV